MTVVNMADERAKRGRPKVGDFFVCSWGWDQTNVDFYEVVEVSTSGKTVKVQQVEIGAVESPSGHSMKVVPFPGTQHPYAEPKGVLTKRLGRVGDRWKIRVASYADGYLWDGEPRHATPIGMGH